MNGTALRDLNQIEKGAGLAGLSADVVALLADGPEPLRAQQRAAQLLKQAHAIDPDRLTSLWRLEARRFGWLLWATCSVAPFLTGFFLREPRRIFELLEDDLSQPRSGASYESRLESALAGVAAAAEPDALRRFKYYELARITLRDCCEELVPRQRVGETLAELSHLADAILSRAFRGAAAIVETRSGPPQWTGPDQGRVRLGFSILALGKLGSEELNYSSDVDLIYVFESPPSGSETLQAGPAGRSPREYFSQLANEFGPRVSNLSSEGFLYRIDLDLRPEGSRGPLVISSDALTSYYDGAAAIWERAAFMKARPVAGDLDFGWRVVRQVAPMLHRTSMDLSGVDAIRSMKNRIREEREGSRAGFDLKHGRGGIRDIEFVAQALQLLHGGRIPQVRARSTQEALRALAGNGVLSAEHADGLLGAYYFLRRLENRLQMESERQVHRLPEDGAGRERAARSMGYAGHEAVAAFDGELADRRQTVREIFDLYFQEGGADRILDLFSRAEPRLLAIATTRQMIEELAQRFAREIEASADPELAFNSLDRFIQGIGTRSVYYGLLLDRPELVSRLAALFGSSRYLSAILARQPALIEPVFSDPEVLLPSRLELTESLESLRRQFAESASRDPVEAELAALRCFQNRELVNVGLLDLAGKISLEQVESALSDLAESCLTHALELARRILEGQRGRSAGEFLVVGMGKLASLELSYGSDLDLIFLYQLPALSAGDSLDAQEYSVRLAQKLVWVLQAQTAEGQCYEVDARLRPSGNQGMLVSSLDSFNHYHATSAQVWERQALLRARPIAGSEELSRQFEQARETILLQPLPTGLAAEIHRIRVRMENELARERKGHRDLKTGRGGLVEVENVVQFLQLVHGGEYPQLFEVVPLATLIEVLEGLGLLSADHARDLLAGWQFMRRLSGRLRIVENRSISEIDEGRGDLDAVARALNYRPSPRTGNIRGELIADYQRHSDAIRQVYLEVLGVTSS